MQHIREEYVIEGATASGPLVILDGLVVDLSDFLERHPGGPAVLLANLGRDVSADFHHVTAHARNGVIREVNRHVIAEVDRATIPPAWGDFSNLLDYVRLVLNSFGAQSAPERDPLRDLVYVGQLYCHFVGEHLCSFLNTLSGLTGITVTTNIPWHLREIFEAVPGQIEDVIVAADKSAATILSRRMQQRCTALLNDLLGISAGAIRELRATGNEDILAVHVKNVLSVVNEWTREEYDLVVSG